MTDETESLESTETTDESTGVSSDASESSDAQGSAQAAPAKTTEEFDWSKAFEHPRFKELVEQKNSALQAQQELRQQIAEMQHKFSQPKEAPAPSKEQTEAQALIEDLKKIDPRLASQIEASLKAQASMQTMQSKIEQFEKQQASERQQATIQAAVTKITSLHDTNKVSPEIRQLVNTQLDVLWRDGKLNAQNIDTEYAKTLGNLNKMFDDIDRARRESYVAGKKKDGQVPTSQPKGTPAKGTPKKVEWSKDPEERNAQIVKSFLKERAAVKEADSV